MKKRHTVLRERTRVDYNLSWRPPPHTVNLIDAERHFALYCNAPNFETDAKTLVEIYPSLRYTPYGPTAGLAEETPPDQTPITLTPEYLSEVTMSGAICLCHRAPNPLLEKIAGFWSRQCDDLRNATHATFDLYADLVKAIMDYPQLVAIVDMNLLPRGHPFNPRVFVLNLHMRDANMTRYLNHLASVRVQTVDIVYNAPGMMRERQYVDSLSFVAQLVGWENYRRNTTVIESVPGMTILQVGSIAVSIREGVKDHISVNGIKNLVMPNNFSYVERWTEALQAVATDIQLRNDFFQRFVPLL